ncbi:Fe-S metabolism protein SufE [bacterium 336/3]|jgi:cysteine desulfuration protein SufE|nr:Fe-S metabolism protein SufE [bacterium 336/3]
MTIQEIQDEIISNFELFDDWDDKYGYIIELGKKLPILAPEYKTEDNLVRGCQSQVWLHAYTKDGKIFFEGDSDAIIVKGLVSLLIKVLSEHTPEEISQADLHFLSKVGLQQHLSMTRANGLASMIKQMKAYSLAFQNV